MIEQNRPVALSLFSGAGGLDSGFHQAGFKIVACVEQDSKCCHTLQLNLERYLDQDCKIINRDIRQLETHEINIPKVDFIIGGPPCQSFSAIGRRAGGVEGIQYPRGSLFEHYCRLLDLYKPKGFLFENVRGILGSHKGKDWQLIREAFTRLGYNLFYRVLDCADYGVPQHRERLILVGTVEDAFKFPRPTHGPDSFSQQPHITALEAILDIQNEAELIHTYPGKYGHLLEEVPPGMNYHYFTKEMGYANPVFAWRSRFSDFLYKADPSKPVRTIVAQLGAYSGPFHWKNRKFTLQEFKRLQTFPDNYQFAGSLNSALKQIGNSVSPLFSEKLAKSVLDQLFGFNLSIDLLEANEKLSFDIRKSKKAKFTRSKRLDHSQTVQLSLFAVEQKFADRKKAIKTVQNNNETTLFNYSSFRQRNQVTEGLLPKGGTNYRFHFERSAEICSIFIFRYKEEIAIETPLLQYCLHFNHLMGNGLKTIICTLLSDTAEDLPVVWDAIEDYLNRNSGYQTMIDIYGHFTEPHPIFDLTLNIFESKLSFLSKFAKFFSNFEATEKLFSEQVLKEMYKKRDFVLSEVAYQLRSLRFDVRVNETNKNIPPGYFRCCYPFTININRQISVKWIKQAK